MQSAPKGSFRHQHCRRQQPTGPDRWSGGPFPRGGLGYGAPRVEVCQTRLPVITAPAAKSRQVWHLAIGAGLGLAAIYTLCIIADLLFPGLLQTYRFWETLLIGVRWSAPWTLLLGLVEVFLSGALAGWAFTLVRRAGPAPATR